MFLWDVIIHLLHITCIWTPVEVKVWISNYLPSCAPCTASRWVAPTPWHVVAAAIAAPRIPIDTYWTGLKWEYSMECFHARKYFWSDRVQFLPLLEDSLERHICASEMGYRWFVFDLNQHLSYCELQLEWKFWWNLNRKQKTKQTKKTSQEMRLEMSSKCRIFCSGLHVLNREAKIMFVRMKNCGSLQLRTDYNIW